MSPPASSLDRFRARAIAARADAPVRISVIGEVVAEPGLWLRTEDGGRTPAEPGGWVHRFHVVEPEH